MTAKPPMTDLTEDPNGPGDDDPTEHPEYKRVTRLVQRIGLVVLGVISLLVFLPMILGVASGISNDRVWDPFTDQPVLQEKPCVDEARRLLAASGQMKSLLPSWAEPYREWKVKCGKDHKALHEALTRTRDELRDGLTRQR